MLRRLTLLAVIAGSLTLPAVHAVQADVPEGGEWTEAFFPSGDGISLHADVIRPAGYDESKKTPVILSIGPYFGTAANGEPGPVNRFPEVFEEGHILEKGYSWVQVDLRGFGSSGGCSDFGGPGEQADVKAAVEWAASQPWSTGKVGMYGKSYDAWTQVMGLATKPKGLAAAIIQSPIIDGYRTLFMHGVHYASGWYATEPSYQASGITPINQGSSQQEMLNYVEGFAHPDCYAEQLALPLVNDPKLDYWRDRQLDAARGSTVPVFWSHGFLDANTKPDNFMSVWSTLRGPKRGWFGQYDHVRGSQSELTGREGFMDEAMRWFDTYLKGIPAAKTGVNKDPKVEVQDGDGHWRAEAAWPPADAKPWRLPTLGGSYIDGQQSSVNAPANGVWSFTEPAPYDLRFAGLPTYTADTSAATYPVNVVVLVYDVDASGEATYLTRGARTVGVAGRRTVELYPEDWLLRKGHRLGVHVSSTDSSWFVPQHSGQTVALGDGFLTIPFLTFARAKFLVGDQAGAAEIRPVITVDEPTVIDRTAPGRYPAPMRKR